MKQNNEISILRAEPRHLSSIMEIERSSFSDPWSRAFFQSFIESHGVQFNVAVRDDRVVGFCVLRAVLDMGEIYNIAVVLEGRGQGIGTALLRSSIKCGEELGLKKIFLEVRRGNAKAILLYERMGFCAAGIRHGYYTSPKEDAITMIYEYGEETADAYIGG